MHPAHSSTRTATIAGNRPAEVLLLVVLAVVSLIAMALMLRAAFWGLMPLVVGP